MTTPVSPDEILARQERVRAALDACASSCPDAVAAAREAIDLLIEAVRENARQAAIAQALDAIAVARDSAPAEWTVEAWKYGWKQGASEAWLRVGAIVSPELAATIQDPPPRKAP